MGGAGRGQLKHLKMHDKSIRSSPGLNLIPHPKQWEIAAAAAAAISYSDKEEGKQAVAADPVVEFTCMKGVEDVCMDPRAICIACP